MDKRARDEYAWRLIEVVRLEMHKILEGDAFAKDCADAKRKLRRFPNRLPRSQELEKLLTIVNEQITRAEVVQPLCVYCSHFDYFGRKDEFRKSWAKQYSGVTYRKGQFKSKDVAGTDLETLADVAWEQSGTVICDPVKLRAGEPLLYLCPSYAKSRNAPNAEETKAQTDALRKVKEMYLKELNDLLF